MPYSNHTRVGAPFGVANALNSALVPTSPVASCVVTAGGLIGRVISEALPNGITPKAFAGTFTSKPAGNGLKTVVKYQRVLAQRYFDAAGFPGRTVGLDAESGKQKTAGN